MLYFLPFCVLFICFTIIPVVISFGMSFTDFDMFNTSEFVGFENYKTLFMDDDIFYLALKNTLVFAVISAPIGYILSFLMAWGINQLKFKSLFSLAFYIPSITSSIAMSVVWLYFFSSDRYGLINNALINLGIINEPILWNQNPNTILPVIIIISIWLSMGNGFLVFLAGIQGLSPEIAEAGSLDGISNKFQELRYIILPQLKPQLLFGSINSLVAAFGVFDIAVAVAGLPSPNYAGHTIVAHLYDYAFIRFEMGYASAVSVILFIMTFFFGRMLNRKMLFRDVFRTIFFLPVVLGMGFAMNQLMEQDIQQRAMNEAVSFLLPDEISKALGEKLSGMVFNYFGRIVSVLWRSGVQILLFLAGLQGISPTIYEAAKVDAADAWETFWLITIPMMVPTIMLNLIYTIIDSFTDSTNSLINYIISTGFNDNHFEYASAFGWLYFLIIFVIILIVIRLFRTSMENAREV